uniref:35kDa protein n=1 Tax=Spodoptera litura multicapsid nucleopolyhedrovirus TaxID=46242 RepID=O41275_NPVST|nr:35kDa protein [Spodoptera litura nucleopolyhedrovirus]
MCVIFRGRNRRVQTIIEIVRWTTTRELCTYRYEPQLTKPVLMMFNISGPIRTVTRKNNNLRDRIKSKVDEQLINLERDYSDQMDGFHDSIKYFKDEHYSVSSQNGSVLKSKFAKILKSQDYTDKKSIEVLLRNTVCPNLVDERNDYYVAVCVLKPGFENGSNQVLSFEYNPIGNKVIVPFAHEINDTGLYEYDVVAYVDSVQFDGEQFEEFVQSLILPSFVQNRKVLYYNEASKNKSMIYKALEFTTESSWGKSEKYNWKIFCNGFIYDKKSKVLYVKLHNVTSALNKNVILNTIK